MVFCTKCGAQLSEDAHFCPRCGARTTAGKEAGASIPLDEVRESFHRIGIEVEKAFRMAADEMRQAFKTAGENIRETASRKQVTCPNCGEKNASDAVYCVKCGKKLK
jgi:uncharacterized membrane protein YvbJ